MLQLDYNTFKVILFCTTEHFLQQFLKRHMKNHMANFSNSLGHRKYFLKLILSIGFQFWEALRGTLHQHNFYLTTPWPKARKNLNLRSKFKDFSWPSAKGWSFYFLQVFFFAQYDHLEGAHSLSLFWRQISSLMGSIDWVGVQTWLRSSHEGTRYFLGGKALTTPQGQTRLFADRMQ